MFVGLLRLNGSSGRVFRTDCEPLFYVEEEHGP